MWKSRTKKSVAVGVVAVVLAITMQFLVNYFTNELSKESHVDKHGAMVSTDGKVVKTQMQEMKVGADGRLRSRNGDASVKTMPTLAKVALASSLPDATLMGLEDIAVHSDKGYTLQIKVHGFSRVPVLNSRCGNIVHFYTAWNGRVTLDSTDLYFDEATAAEFRNAGFSLATGGRRLAGAITVDGFAKALDEIRRSGKWSCADVPLPTFSLLGERKETAYERCGFRKDKQNSCYSEYGGLRFGVATMPGTFVSSNGDALYNKFSVSVLNSDRYRVRFTEYPMHPGQQRVEVSDMQANPPQKINFQLDPVSKRRSFCSVEADDMERRHREAEEDDKLDSDWHIEYLGMNEEKGRVLRHFRLLKSTAFMNYFFPDSGLSFRPLLEKVDFWDVAETLEPVGLMFGDGYSLTVFDSYKPRLSETEMAEKMTVRTGKPIADLMSCSKKEQNTKTMLPEMGSRDLSSTDARYYESTLKDSNITTSEFWKYLDAALDPNTLSDFCYESCIPEMEGAKYEHLITGADVGECSAALSRVMTCLRETGDGCEASNFVKMHEMQCAKIETQGPKSSKLEADAEEGGADDALEEDAEDVPELLRVSRNETIGHKLNFGGAPGRKLFATSGSISGLEGHEESAGSGLHEENWLTEAPLDSEWVAGGLEQVKWYGDDTMFNNAHKWTLFGAKYGLPRVSKFADSVLKRFRNQPEIDTKSKSKSKSKNKKASVLDDVEKDKCQDPKVQGTLRRSGGHWCAFWESAGLGGDPDFHFFVKIGFFYTYLAIELAMKACADFRIVFPYIKPPLFADCCFEGEISASVELPDDCPGVIFHLRGKAAWVLTLGFELAMVGGFDAFVFEIGIAAGVQTLNTGGKLKNSQGEHVGLEDQCWWVPDDVDAKEEWGVSRRRGTKKCNYRNECDQYIEGYVQVTIIQIFKVRINMIYYMKNKILTSKIRTRYWLFWWRDIPAGTFVFWQMQFGEASMYKAENTDCSITGDPDCDKKDEPPPLPTPPLLCTEPEMVETYHAKAGSDNYIYWHTGKLWKRLYEHRKNAFFRCMNLEGCNAVTCTDGRDKKCTLRMPIYTGRDTGVGEKDPHTNYLVPQRGHHTWLLDYEYLEGYGGGEYLDDASKSYEEKMKQCKNIEECRAVTCDREWKNCRLTKAQNQADCLRHPNDKWNTVVLRGTLHEDMGTTFGHEESNDRFRELKPHKEEYSWDDAKKACAAHSACKAISCKAKFTEQIHAIDFYAGAHEAKYHSPEKCTLRNSADIKIGKDPTHKDSYVSSDKDSSVTLVFDKKCKTRYLDPSAWKCPGTSKTEILEGKQMTGGKLYMNNGEAITRIFDNPQGFWIGDKPHEDWHRDQTGEKIVDGRTEENYNYDRKPNDFDNRANYLEGAIDACKKEDGCVAMTCGSKNRPGRDCTLRASKNEDELRHTEMKSEVTRMLKFTLHPDKTSPKYYEWRMVYRDHMEAKRACKQWKSCRAITCEEYSYEFNKHYSRDWFNTCNYSTDCIGAGSIPAPMQPQRFVGQIPADLQSDDVITVTLNHCTLRNEADPKKFKGENDPKDRLDINVSPKGIKDPHRRHKNVKSKFVTWSVGWEEHKNTRAPGYLMDETGTLVKILLDKCRNEPCPWWLGCNDWRKKQEEYCDWGGDYEKTIQTTHYPNQEVAMRECMLHPECRAVTCKEDPPRTCTLRRKYKAADLRHYTGETSIVFGGKRYYDKRSPGRFELREEIPYYQDAVETCKGLPGCHAVSCKDKRQNPPFRLGGAKIDLRAWTPNDFIDCTLGDVKPHDTKDMIEDLIEAPPTDWKDKHRERCNEDGCFRRVDDQQRCWFYGKCDENEMFSCPKSDVDCMFNRNIDGQWFCVHHKKSHNCAKVRLQPLLGCNGAGCFKRQDNKQRCWFHGKCEGPEIYSCPDESDVDCQFNREIKGEWFCVHHQDSPDCKKIGNGFVAPLHNTVTYLIEVVKYQRKNGGIEAPGYFRKSQKVDETYADLEAAQTACSMFGEACKAIQCAMGRKDCTLSAAHPLAGEELVENKSVVTIIPSERCQVPNIELYTRFTCEDWTRKDNAVAVGYAPEAEWISRRSFSEYSDAKDVCKQYDACTAITCSDVVCEDEKCEKLKMKDCSLKAPDRRPKYKKKLTKIDEEKELGQNFSAKRVNTYMPRWKKFKDKTAPGYYRPADTMTAREEALDKRRNRLNPLTQEQALELCKTSPGCRAITCHETDLGETRCTLRASQRESDLKPSNFQEIPVEWRGGKKNEPKRQWTFLYIDGVLHVGHGASESTLKTPHTTTYTSEVEAKRACIKLGPACKAVTCSTPKPTHVPYKKVYNGNRDPYDLDEETEKIYKEHYDNYVRRRKRGVERRKREAKEKAREWATDKDLAIDRCRKLEGCNAVTCEKQFLGNGYLGFHECTLRMPLRKNNAGQWLDDELVDKEGQTTWLLDHPEQSHGDMPVYHNKYAPEKFRNPKEIEEHYIFPGTPDGDIAKHKAHVECTLRGSSDLLNPAHYEVLRDYKESGAYTLLPGMTCKDKQVCSKTECGWRTVYWGTQTAPKETGRGREPNIHHGERYLPSEAPLEWRDPPFGGGGGWLLMSAAYDEEYRWINLRCDEPPHKGGCSNGNSLLLEERTDRYYSPLACGEICYANLACQSWISPLPGSTEQICKTFKAGCQKDAYKANIRGVYEVAKCLYRDKTIIDDDPSTLTSTLIDIDGLHQTCPRVTSSHRANMLPDDLFHIHNSLACQSKTDVGGRCWIPFTAEGCGSSTPVAQSCYTPTTKNDVNCKMNRQREDRPDGKWFCVLHTDNSLCKAAKNGMGKFTDSLLANGQSKILWDNLEILGKDLAPPQVPEWAKIDATEWLDKYELFAHVESATDSRRDWGVGKNDLDLIREFSNSVYEELEEMSKKHFAKIKA